MWSEILGLGLVVQDLSREMAEGNLLGCPVSSHQPLALLFAQLQTACPAGSVPLTASDNQGS